MGASETPSSATPPTASHGANLSQNKTTPRIAPTMHNWRSVRTLMYATITPDSNRLTVRLPQYTLTQTPATTGTMPRASVSSVYSHWPAVSSRPVYTKKSSILSHADGNAEVRIHRRARGWSSEDVPTQQMPSSAHAPQR